MNKSESTNKNITVSHYIDDDLWSIKFHKGSHTPIHLTFEEMEDLQDILGVVIKEFKELNYGSV